MTPQDQREQQHQQIHSIGGEVREQDKIMLVLCYLGLFCLIPLLTVRDSDYVKYHAKNGLVLNAIGWSAFAILLSVPLLWIPDCMLMLSLIVVNLIGITRALKGERWVIPVVSNLAAKF